MPTPKTTTQDLAAALQDAAGAVGSEITLANILRLVKPGVYVKMSILVSREPGGDYKLSMSSATHGTKCNILLRKNLAGAAVEPADFEELKRSLKGEGPKAKEDRRFPDDWK